MNPADAAETALTPHIPTPHTRRTIAQHTANTINTQTRDHGLPHILAMTQNPDRRQPAINQITAAVWNDLWITVNPTAVDAAVRAAARAVWNNHN